MNNPPSYPQRKNIRLQGYDYTQAGAYFITLVTWQRECLFGEVVGEEMQVNELGRIFTDIWEATLNIRPNVILDEYIVMPNHFHGIILFNDIGRGEALPRPLTTGRPTGSPLPGMTAGSIGAIIGQIKSLTTKQINHLRQTPGEPVWQRNYYDHIIRDEAEMERIYQYILQNPSSWADDPENLQDG